MDLKEYKLNIYGEYGKIYFSKLDILDNVIDMLLTRLYNINALSCIENGYFKTTYMITDKHIKRFIVECKFPYTIFEIRKYSVGDIDQETVLAVLNRKLKEYKEK